jgi:hypothetical protein
MTIKSLNYNLKTLTISFSINSCIDYIPYNIELYKYRCSPRSQARYKNPTLIFLRRYTSLTFLDWFLVLERVVSFIMLFDYATRERERERCGIQMR